MVEDEEGGEGVNFHKYTVHRYLGNHKNHIQYSGTYCKEGM